MSETEHEKPPEKIWLQPGMGMEGDTTWCDVQIDDDDPAYILETLHNTELAQLRAEVERLTADLAAARAERDALKAELAAAQQWVDPAERLPEQDCVVWACRKTASGLREVCRAFVDDNDVWRIDTLSAERITVTHWQEITAPQPPSNEHEQKDGEG